MARLGTVSNRDLRAVVAAGAEWVQPAVLRHALPAIVRRRRGVAA